MSTAPGTRAFGNILPDRHPLKVGPHGIHLALVDADKPTAPAEGIFSVVQRAEAVSVPIVSNLCVCRVINRKRARAILEARGSYRGRPRW